MTKIRIEYNRNKCIGAWACVSLGPNDFGMNYDESKADLIEGKEEKPGLMVKEIEVDEERLQQIKFAAQSCPPMVIKVVNLETGEVLVNWDKPYVDGAKEAKQGSGPQNINE